MEAYSSNVLAPFTPFSFTPSSTSKTSTFTSFVVSSLGGDLLWIDNQL